MFKKNLIIALIFLFVCALAIGIWCTKINPKDYFLYKQIIAKSKAQKRSSEKSHRQERKNVQKLIWSTGENPYLFCKLFALKSSLVHLKKSDIVEHMKYLKGYIQEKRYFVLPDGRKAYENDDGNLFIDDILIKPSAEEIENWIPMQRIVFINAENASYYYKTKTLEATDVYMERYCIEGHEIDESKVAKQSPMMKGTSAKATFNIKNKSPSFKASNLKAKFYPEFL